MKRLETCCLSLGKDKTMDKESMIRWDLVYDLFESHKEVMLHSSLSAVNVTDKQDRSLVIDISRLYELFLFHGYTYTQHLDCFSKPHTSLMRLFWIKNLIHMREFTKCGGQKHSSLLGAQIHRTKASTLLIRLSKI